MEDAGDNFVRRLRDAHALGKLVGDSPAFRRALATLPAASRSEAAVLITGETGTGKELVARALHYLSDRAAYPFVAVNCGSTTDTLLEDELFGHARGAFTDAQHRRAGLIAHANRGTLFLDEIDTLAPRGQVALLRVLQDGVFRPLGSDQAHEAHVRFLAATNAPLQKLVETGSFRADLYYRLCVFSIDLPPLRERKEDILGLALHFLDKHAPDRAAAFSLSPTAVAALYGFEWPGNVRELENVMIRAIQLCDTGTIEVEHLRLPGRVMGGSSAGSSPAHLAGAYRTLKRQVVETFERGYLTQLMRDSRGNVTRAARMAGKERRDLGRLLKRHGLDPTRFAGRSPGAAGA